jgi:hypothetical protein
MASEESIKSCPLCNNRLTGDCYYINNRIHQIHYKCVCGCYDYIFCEGHHIEIIDLICWEWSQEETVTEQSLRIAEKSRYLTRRKKERDNRFDWVRQGF